MPSNRNPVVNLVRFTPNDEDFLNRKLGSRGEVFYDRDNETLRIYNGADTAGIKLARNDLIGVSETDFVSLASSSRLFGPNIHIHNTVVNSNNVDTGDKDYVTFTVGTNNITAFYLTKYVGVDLIAFFAIQEGDAWTVGQDVNQMLTYGHLGSGGALPVGINILAGNPLHPGAVTLAANTTYTVWIQQTGSNITEYALSTNPYWVPATADLPADYSSDPATPTILYQDGAGQGGATVSVGNTLPEDPENGNLWLNTDNGKLYVYIDDGTSTQWMQPFVPMPSLGSISFTGTVIDSVDSSLISFTPAVTFNSDVRIENDLIIAGNIVYGNEKLATESYVSTALEQVVVEALSINASTVGLGNVTNESKATMFTSPTFTGTSTFQQSVEVLNTKTGATGTVNHDYSTGAIWYHTSLADNFTANFTNVPTTASRAISIVLVLIQGATPYVPNVLQIDGTPVTINWLAGLTPSGNASKKDIVSFTFTRIASSWTVFGSLSSFGT